MMFLDLFDPWRPTETLRLGQQIFTVTRTQKCVFCHRCCVGCIQGTVSTEWKEAAIILNRLPGNRSVSRGLGPERTCELE